MSHPKSARKGRALGVVIASVFAAGPTAGCSESHPAVVDAHTPTSDAAPAVDAAAPTPDAASTPDASIAMVDASITDAGTWEDTDVPDSYYPDGVRG